MKIINHKIFAHGKRRKDMLCTQRRNFQPRRGETIIEKETTRNTNPEGVK